MEEKKVDEVPVDILLEVLLRLPAKSLGRFVCVSKMWARIIRCEDFVRWFSLRLKKQPPRFLLALNSRVKGYQESWSFFSRSTLVSTLPCESGQFAALWRHMKVPCVEEEPLDFPSSTACELKKVRDIEPDFLSSTVCEFKKVRDIDPCYAHGLISFLYGEEQVVCNPSTGKSVTLPTLKSSEMIVRSFLGYDPIDAQYKVLCLTNVTRFCEHHVLTLGSTQTQSCSWSMVQCSTPHYALGTRSVCIGGVLYYTASAAFATKEPFLAAFDLRSETLETASCFLRVLLLIGSRMQL